MDLNKYLTKLDFSEKETAVYLALLRRGSQPVREIAREAKVNRGTAYDVLKELIKKGLVSHYTTRSHQHFSAEPLEKLLGILEEKEQSIREMQKNIRISLPELKSIYVQKGGRPSVKLYEGRRGIRTILEDVLASVAVSKEKKYFVYSSANLRKDVYEAMPEFTRKRIKHKVKVKTIALGRGGELHGLDERKWMHIEEENLKPVYEIIYAGKVAHISLNNTSDPVGVVIENEEIFFTQKMIFEFNWQKLT